MKRAMIFVLVGVLLAGCSAAQPVPTATATAIPQPSATPQPTATQTLPPPTATVTATLPPPTATSTSIPPFSQIIAFGDSYSDNGTGLLPMANQIFNAEVLEWFETYYWEGRSSNGPAAVEILAEKLKIGLEDFAVSGARSDYGNNMGDEDGLKTSGLLGQVDKFQAGLDGKKADPAALYFVHISINDFLALLWSNPAHDPGLTMDTADEAVANMVDAVNQLADSGARQFLIVNSIYLSQLPTVIEAGFADDAMAFQSRVNSKLSDEMEKLSKERNLKIIIFDYMAASDRIINNSGSYGLTDLTDYCLVSTDTATEMCKSPDEYYFWDYVHPSRRVHQLIGEAMAEQLSK
jgi:cholinesterase